MKDALEVRWKNHSYKLKTGTIVLFGTPLPAIREVSLDYRDYFIQRTVFAGVVVGVINEPPAAWIYTLYYPKEIAAIDSYASHGVTLRFNDGDKWLITPATVVKIVSDLNLDLNPVKLIDDNGRDIRTLSGVRSQAFRFSSKTFDKYVPIIGTNERMVDLLSWPPMLLRGWLNVTSKSTAVIDTLLSANRKLTLDDILMVQQHIASVKASERLAPPPKQKKASGIQFNAYSSAFGRVTQRPTGITGIDFEQLGFAADEGMARVPGHPVEGKVGAFPALSIPHNLILFQNERDIDLELDSNRHPNTIELLKLDGEVLCSDINPFMITISHEWLTNRLGDIAYKCRVMDRGHFLYEFYALPINPPINSYVLQVLKEQYPSWLSDSMDMLANRQLSTATAAAESSDFYASVDISENILNRIGGSTYKIRIDDLSDKEVRSLLHYNTVVRVVGSGGITSYRVAPSSFLYSRSSVRHLIIAELFRRHDTAPPTPINIVWIEDSAYISTSLNEYLEDSNGLMPERPAPSQATITVPTTITVSPRNATISNVTSSIMINYDAISLTAAKKVTQIGTIIAVQNPDSGQVIGRWEIAADGIVPGFPNMWTLSFASDRRSTAINSKQMTLIKLSSNENRSTSRPRPAPARAVALGGLVTVDDNYVNIDHREQKILINYDGLSEAAQRAVCINGNTLSVVNRSTRQLRGRWEINHESGDYQIEFVSPNGEDVSNLHTWGRSHQSNRGITQEQPAPEPTYVVPPDSLLEELNQGGYVSNYVTAQTSTLSIHEPPSAPPPINAEVSSNAELFWAPTNMTPPEQPLTQTQRITSDTYRTVGGFVYSVLSAGVLKVSLAGKVYVIDGSNFVIDSHHRNSIGGQLHITFKSSTNPSQDMTGALDVILVNSKWTRPDTGRTLPNSQPTLAVFLDSYFQVAGPDEPEEMTERPLRGLDFFGEDDYEEEGI